MFWKKQDEIVISLKNKIAYLKNEAEEACKNALKYKDYIKKIKDDLKSQKKREMQEVEHLVKMSKEKNEIEFELRAEIKEWLN